MLTNLKVTGLVHVCVEPSLSYTPSNKAVCTFFVAANSQYTTENGDKKEDSCFMQCTAWGKLAESINKYLNKGDPCYIEGNMKEESWENKDKVKFTRHSITVNHIVYLKQKDS